MAGTVLGKFAVYDLVISSPFLAMLGLEDIIICIVDKLART